MAKESVKVDYERDFLLGKLFLHLKEPRFAASTITVAKDGEIVAEFSKYDIVGLLEFLEENLQ